MKNKYLLAFIIFLSSVSLFPEIVLKLDVETAQTMAVLEDDGIRIDRMNQRIAERSYWMSFIQFFPRFSTSYSISNLMLYDIQSQQASLFTVPYKQSLSLSVQQNIFNGGKTITNSYFRFYELGLLKKGLEEKEKVIRTGIDSLYSEVYFNELKVIQMARNLEFMRQEYQIIKKKYELEVITELDYNEFLLKINEAEIKLAQQQREYDFVLQELKEKLGIEEQIELLLTSVIEVPEISIDEKLSETFSHLTFTMSSKSNTLKLNMYKTRTQQMMTYMSLLPSVSASFSYNFEGDRWPLYGQGWQLGFNVSWALPGLPVEFSHNSSFPSSKSDELDVIDTDSQMLGNIGNSVSISYLSNLESINEFGKANIELLKAKNEYDKFLSSTTKGIKKTIKEYNESIRMLALTKQREEILQKKLMIEKVKYEQGTGRVIDVFESEMKLYETRLGIIDIQNKIYKFIISIKNLTGISTDEFYALIKK